MTNIPNPYFKRRRKTCNLGGTTSRDAGEGSSVCFVIDLESGFSQLLRIDYQGQVNLFDALDT